MLLPITLAPVVVSAFSSSYSRRSPSSQATSAAFPHGLDSHETHSTRESRMRENKACLCMNAIKYAVTEYIPFFSSPHPSQLARPSDFLQGTKTRPVPLPPATHVQNTSQKTAGSEYDGKSAYTQNDTDSAFKSRILSTRRCVRHFFHPLTVLLAPTSLASVSRSAPTPDPSSRPRSARYACAVALDAAAAA
ncbi:hypothetical protein B0H14DRAFT_3736768 [Mycena olivaceomarginata]|nr:hypothetical protein B0H14DRAFT_3736768 [Mycena olivaceomarginata]